MIGDEGLPPIASHASSRAGSRTQSGGRALWDADLARAGRAAPGHDDLGSTVVAGELGRYGMCIRAFLDTFLQGRPGPTRGPADKGGFSRFLGRPAASALAMGPSNDPTARRNKKKKGIQPDYSPPDNNLPAVKTFGRRATPVLLWRTDRSFGRAHQRLSLRGAEPRGALRGP